MNNCVSADDVSRHCVQNCVHTSKSVCRINELTIRYFENFVNIRRPSFPGCASGVWNSLSHHVTSAQSLPVFCSRLKTHLFRRSFPWLHCCAREVTLIIMHGHVNRRFYLLIYFTTATKRAGIHCQMISEHLHALLRVSDAAWKCSFSHIPHISSIVIMCSINSILTQRM